MKKKIYISGEVDGKCFAAEFSFCFASDFIGLVLLKISEGKKN